MLKVILTEKFKLTTEIRGFKVYSDLKPENGGDNTAIEPPEMLQVSLATCVGMFFLFFCNMRKIDPTGFTLELDAEMSHAPKMFTSFFIKLHLPPNFPEDQKEAALRYIHACPVGTTIQKGAEINIELY